MGSGGWQVGSRAIPGPGQVAGVTVSVGVGVGVGVLGGVSGDAQSTHVRLARAPGDLQEAGEAGVQAPQDRVALGPGERGGSDGFSNQEGDAAGAEADPGPAGTE